MNTNETNPLLSQDKFIPFDKIKAEHFVPAAKALIEKFKQKLSTIPKEEASVTFENTFGVFAEIMDRAHIYMATIGSYNSLMSTPDVEKAYQEAEELLVAFDNELYLNEHLFNALESCSDSEEGKNLGKDEKRALQEAIKHFKLEGAKLNSEQKEELKKLNQEISTLHNKFANNLKNSTFNLVLESADDMVGLPEAYIEGAREKAEAIDELKGKNAYVVNLDAPSYIPFMKFSEKRELRKKLHLAYMQRATKGDLDNRPIIEELLTLRHKKGKLLGFSNYAEMSLAKKSAGSSKIVSSFLERLDEKSNTGGRQENDAILAFAKTFDDSLTHVPAYDYGYYSEKLKEKNYNYNENQVKEYFELNQCIHGLFEVANRMFDIEITPTTGVPVWHPDVRVYELKEDGKLLSYLYLDLHPRSKIKTGGAWMNAVVHSRHEENQSRPAMVQITCNFTEPTKDQPALLTANELETLFHEFGHAIHGALNKNKIVYNSMENCSWDVIEFPSHFMEHWALEKETFELIGKHYKTGEKMPSDLIDKVVASKKFQAFSICRRQLSFGTFDMLLHSEDPEARRARKETVNDVWKQMHKRFSASPFIEGTYFEAGFGHLFTNSAYSAGYYSYKWSEVLAADGFAAFRESGDIFNKDLAKKYKDNILAKGNLEDMGDLYKAFRGRPATEDALIKEMEG